MPSTQGCDIDKATLAHITWSLGTALTLLVEKSLTK